MEGNTESGFVRDGGRRRAARAKTGQVDVAVAVVDGHSKLTRPVCRVLRCLALPSAPLGMQTLIGCANSPEKGRSLCELHGRLAKELPARIHPDGASLTQVKWTKAVARSVNEMVTMWACAPGKEPRRVSFDELPRDELVKFQCRQALSVEDNLVEDTTGLGQDVSDETTLLELASLKCTTHKMAVHRKRVAEPKDVPAKRRRKCARSGGFLLACTPQGYILDVFEFMGTESCSQRYFFIARVEATFPRALRTIARRCVPLASFRR